MTTGMTALGIMTRPDIRQANIDGAPVVVLTPSLDGVIWANGAGARLVGVLPGAHAEPQPLKTSLPTTRQIASVSRRLAQSGEARLILRAPGGSMKPAVAEVRLVEVSGERHAILIADPTSAGEALSPEHLAERLIEEAGLSDGLAAVVSRDGVLAESAAMDIARVGEALDAFRAGSDDLSQARVDMANVRFARLGGDMILVAMEPDPVPPDLGVEEPALEAETPAPPAPPQEEAAPEANPSSPRAFSVKRQPLPSGRHKLDIGALIQRWNSRRADPAAPTDDGQVESQPSRPEAAALPLSEDNDIAPDAPASTEDLEEARHDPASEARSADLKEHDGEASAPTEDFATDRDEDGAATSESLPVIEPDESTAAAPEDAEPVATEPTPLDDDDIVEIDLTVVPRSEDAPSDALADAEGAPPADAAEAGGPEAVSDGEADAADKEGELNTLPDALEATAFEATADGTGEHPLLDADIPAPAPTDPVTLAQEPADTASGDGFFKPDFGTAPVRFVWRIDADGRFRSFSPEFPACVGPHAADVIGRTFREVARVFDFDRTGEIAQLLERRDTWSGRSVLWPVETTDLKVPVDLAALPTYDRERSFDGFRGFGIVRMSEAVPDPDRLGLILTAAGAASKEAPDDRPSQTEGTTEVDGAGMALTASQDVEIRPFGRRASPPQESSGFERDIDASDEPRRLREAILSEAEEAAFRAIGRRLGQNGEEEPKDGRKENEEFRPITAGDFVVRTAPLADNDESEDAASEASSGDAADRIETLSVAHPAIALDHLGDDEASDDEEEAVEDVLSRLRSRLDQVFGPLPLAVLAQFRDTLAYANPAFLALSGYASAEALSQAGGLGELFAESQEPLQDGRLAMRHADGQVVKTAVRMQRVSFLERACLVISFTADQAKPDHDDRQAETLSEIEELRREVEELQSVLNTATDGVVMLDGEGNIRSMNGAAQAMFAVGPVEVAGRPFSMLMAHESQRIALDYLDMLKDNGLPAMLNDGREVTGRVAKGDGQVPLFITASRLTRERGYCVVIRDITHWKRVEEDLVKARREAEDASLHKSRFLANISHELRTPLNAIIGFADVMASECFGPIGHERYLEYLADIKRSGHHVLDLVNDLLDISKAEAGRAELVFEAVSLNDVVSEVCSLMQPQAGRERVIVRSNLPSSVPPVVADRRSMRQIALNLLSNAIRFTPSGGQVVASTAYSPDGEVILKIRDSGIGMTDKEIELALKPFQQVNPSARERGDGTGLGLPLTKTLTEANEARFSIHSTPGEGTVVEVAFPPQRVLAD
ncbi:ATP-binding protein [Consotaella salsifontis]|uniref:histidine kinase n=1 Tax=Consotaella salsifontis TaxID=1365950 RepID=A0A1T4Q1U3_9HYPH|nr:ATP-binding protein [Consotaella salsifontis]SJZ97699.1 PAS/PAC sensor signal transduction histidine kinase [Consotaella salsifontis]